MAIAGYRGDIRYHRKSKSNDVRRTTGNENMTEGGITSLLGIRLKIRPREEMDSSIASACKISFE